MQPRLKIFSLIFVGYAVIMAVVLVHRATSVSEPLAVWLPGVGLGSTECVSRELDRTTFPREVQPIPFPYELVEPRDWEPRSFTLGWSCVFWEGKTSDVRLNPTQ